MLNRRFFPAALLVLLTAVSCGAARKPGQDFKPGFNLFSKEQDIQLGREAAAQVRQQFQLVPNQQLQDYVTSIGQRLAKQPQAGGYPYSFTLVNEPSVNAFALPGGPTFIHTGLLRAADNESQLAGVIAHEIAHVALRHGTNQASKANLIQLPAMLAGAVVGNGSMVGQLAQLGIGLGASSVLLKYSRDAENQADLLGAKLMAEAGYNPIEVARFFEKLEAEGGNRAPQFLSNHPNPGNRVRSVETEIQSFPQRAYGAESGSFAQMRSMAAQLPPPPKQPQPGAMSAPGGNAPPAAPSGQFRSLEAQQFTLDHPAEWEVFGDRNSNMVTIAPRQGLVQANNGNVAVGYGAIVSYYTPDSGRTTNLEAATNDLIQQMRGANPGLQVRSSPRRVRVNGQNGLLTNLTGASPFGGEEEDVLLTVARPEGLFYMVMVAPQRDFRNIESMFGKMVQSVRFRAR